MSRGTSYFGNGAARSFAYSETLLDIMAGFYGKDTDLLVVPGRFRVKTTSAWTKATHIDTRLDFLL